MTSIDSVDRVEPIFLLRKIAKELVGIDPEDLSKAERNILSYLESAFLVKRIDDRFVVLDYLEMLKLSVERCKVTHPEWRYGQSLFNCLFIIDPKLANSICSTTLDPFYNDSRADAFLKYVADVWQV